MRRQIFDQLFNLSRFQKRAIQMLVDSSVMVLALALAMALRLDGFGFVSWFNLWEVAALVIPPTLMIFWVLGFYNSVVRYFSQLVIIQPLLFGVAGSAALLMAMALSSNWGIPRSVPFIYSLLLLISILGTRFTIRLVYLAVTGRERARVLIYGAGTSGRQLMQTLAQGTDYLAVGFVDRDRDLQGLRLGGLKVHSPDRLPELIVELAADILLLAIPSATRGERASILRQLRELPIKVQTIPGIEDLVSGRARVSDVREIEINDLLGRDPVPPLIDLLAHDIVGKQVLVTGAGGSIGSELCRQIIKLDPAKLLLVEMSELALYSIELELRAMLTRQGTDTEIIPVLGSVQNAALVHRLLDEHGVETVYHAAAYKHVPLVEGNVVEGVRNNVFGTHILATACQEHGVEAFILVSTDKAVRPTNVMGATKRVAELICQALAATPTNASVRQTRFSIVRFGNVLGSSGSVIPLFRQQVAAGGPVTVTHPEVTRYFMTIPEAAMLVIQSGAMARGGDVFLLNMGEPITITELAKQLVSQSGFTPVIIPPGTAIPNDLPPGQIAICFTGMRPGEKLYEELLIDGSGEKTRHPDIIRGDEVFLPLDELLPSLDRLRGACDARADTVIIDILKALPTGFSPDAAGERRE